MSSSASTLITLAQVNGYAKLSERDLLLCLAGLYGANQGLTAQTALALAAQKGYPTLSDEDLNRCWLDAIS